MKRIFLLLLLLMSASVAFAESPKRIFVTSLANSGPGTLRACMEASGTRECWFDSNAMLGVINLKSPIIVKYPNLIVSGESVINLELHGAGIRIQASNVEIHHLAVRPGARYKDSKTWDGVVIWSLGKLENVWLDHMSITWAVDENLSSYGPNIKGVCVTNSIIAEGLHCSIHPDGCHSKGVLWGPNTKEIIMDGNLFAHNHDRNVRMKEGVTMSFGNNVVYNWGGSSGWNLLNFTDKAGGKQVAVDFIENFYKPGINSTIKFPPIYYDKNVPRTSRVFSLGNFAPTLPEYKSLPSSMVASEQLFKVRFDDFKTSREIEERIALKVGPHPAHRSKVDQRIVNEMLTRTGRIKDCVEGCPNNAGGWN